MPLSGKQLVLCVGGGIAAYKAAELARELIRRGASLRAVLTPSATRFIGPTTFTGLCGKPAVVDLWDPSYPGEVHVELSKWADAIVVAPATANLLARAALGLADDAVLTTLSCADCPVLYAPAMHERMWNRSATQRNAAQLRDDGAVLVGPVQGALASGEQGMGRMAEPAQIADAVQTALGSKGDLAGRTVVISAGPTLEDIDPVRFLSNRSSGRMGFALAAAARDRGARVIVVAGPVSIEPPQGVQLRAVRSAREMHTAVLEHQQGADVVIMTAAVADYRPADAAPQKIKKDSDRLSIELVKNPDILADLGKGRAGLRPLLVGFAMETHDVLTYARGKLQAKGVDLMVANEAAVGFGGDDTQLTLVDASGDTALPPSSKRTAADRVLDHVCQLLDSK